MGKDNSEQIKRIEQEAEESAIEAGYMQSDKEVFETTLWGEFNDYVRGYKAGRLKSDEQKDKEFAELKSECSKAIQVAKDNIKKHLAAGLRIKELEDGLSLAYNWAEFTGVQSLDIFIKAKQLLTKNPV